MPKVVVAYVRFVDAMNRRIGRVAMYLIFAMMGILLYSSITKTFFIPPLWTLEMAQFVMVAYYLLGGAYSMQLEGHVRMDLIYGSCSTRRKAWVDSFTVIFLIIYLGFLLYGGFSSTQYALQYGERSFSSWRCSSTQSVLTSNSLSTDVVGMFRSSYFRYRKCQRV